MSGNFGDLDEAYDNIVVTKFLEELLQELYIVAKIGKIGKDYFDYNIEDREDFTNNLLLDYNLDPKNVLEIMTKSSQNINCYSSLIGFFYQHGIGCRVNRAKAFEIYSNAINNEEINKHTSDRKNEVAFCNDNIKRLNAILLQYFYSLFLYKDIIIYRKDNYKLHIKKAEKGDPASQYHVGNCYYYGRNIQKDYNKAIE